MFRIDTKLKIEVKDKREGGCNFCDDKCTNNGDKIYKVCGIGIAVRFCNTCFEMLKSWPDGFPWNIDR